MKWLEIIEIRAVSGSKALLDEYLQSLLKDLEHEARQHAIKIYSRKEFDTDFSIHLLHDSKQMEINGSPLGLHLASTLKEYGLLNHSVWEERFCK